MALQEKDMSEHIELLSDGAIDDLPHVAAAKEDRDPFVEAALAKHHDIQKQHQPALAGGVLDDGLWNTALYRFVFLLFFALCLAQR